MPAGVQGSLIATGPAYAYDSQIGVGSGGDNGNGMMSISNGGHFTNDRDTDGNIMTGFNGETGMEQDFDWNPQDFGFDDPYLNYLKHD